MIDVCRPSDAMVEYRAGLAKKDEVVDQMPAHDKLHNISMDATVFGEKESRLRWTWNRLGFTRFL